MDFFHKDKFNALTAKEEAQRIAFAPFVFQAARAMRDLGVLDVIEAGGETGLTLTEVAEKTGLSIYATRVLLEAGLGIGTVFLRDERYVLGRLGWYLLHDEMTRVNMDFVHEVNYRGFFHLQESLVQGRPAGLVELAPEAATLYQALAGLPEKTLKSWLDFDHFYSDTSFSTILPIIFGQHTRRVLDVGANTGKWAIACARHAPDVQVTLCDLPGQLAMARNAIARHEGLAERLQEYPINILDPETELPGGHDVIWMSQFLDCFSEPEIVMILRKAARVMEGATRLYIMETLWDRQRFENAAFCLQQTSLYFTCMANGNSQMYHSEVLHACIEAAGLKVVDQIDGVGISHSLITVMKDAR